MGHAAFQLRKAIRAFVEGVSFFVQPGHDSEPVGHCCYGRRVDFDGSLLVDLNAADEVVFTFTTRLGHRARCFTIACRIIALVVLATRTALAGAAGILGGFVPMILGLASIYSQVRQLGALLDTLVEVSP